jgi:lysophospholipase L1-like esterase
MMRRHGSRLAALVAVAALVVAACGGHDSTAKRPASSTKVAAHPKGYVVLGDSYSAGSGTPPYDVDQACFASSKGYPLTVSAVVGTKAPQVRACGGAVVAQLAAQIPTEPDPDVGLVTFTIGGNDVLLGPAVAACATADCAGVSSSPDARAALTRLEGSLVDQVYPALRAAYPKARLVQVGYPRITARSGGAACPWLASDEVLEPEHMVDALNAGLRAAVDRSGGTVAFADVSSALDGHELCTATPWVFGIDVGPSSLHPTVEGYAALGHAIAAALQP